MVIGRLDQVKEIFLKFVTLRVIKMTWLISIFNQIILKSLGLFENSK